MHKKRKLANRKNVYGKKIKRKEKKNRKLKQLNANRKKNTATTERKITKTTSKPCTAQRRTDAVFFSLELILLDTNGETSAEKKRISIDNNR